ncbi:ABC transporter ATP-binding protein [Brevibacterium album]|uniref:ABC transporter ATP-binding protein n=1 Tax=Brevibacterium album TaxID=417948 RepID=UPI00040BA694|nr:ABC transporter ATP-binding protein [Brevibacterium album]
MAETQTAAAAQSKEPILSVRDLGVRFWVGDEWFTASRGLTYDLRPGEVLAIVGESGSGKSQSAMSLMGLVPRNGRASGSAKLGGKELIGMPEEQMQRVRGNDISVIFQEPMTALNPVYTAGYQISETLRVHNVMGPREAKEEALRLMRMVEIPDPEERYNSFPHQLSGGQRQRIMIAQALACRPRLLIADEPTTALDVTVQAEILKLMRDLREKVDAGIILITHDMGVVADMADRILVMKEGQVVEEGTATQIFSSPQHPYTRQLLAAVPHLGEGSGTAAFGSEAGALEVVEARPEIPLESDETYVHPGGEAGGRAGETPALRLAGACIEYPAVGRKKAFRAAHSVDLTIGAGEVVGLVGESGSGKTTIGRSAVGLIPVVEGSLTVDGFEVAGKRNRELRDVRKTVGFVFQDPGSSLNPRLPVGESIGEPMLLHQGLKGAELSRRVEELLDAVELPRSMRNRYPHEFSGGQRQRIGIARALALRPKLLIADEPTSALDVSVQAKVLELFGHLQEEYGFACLFISHDLAVVERVAGRIAVMRHGHLLEVGPSADLVADPRHPYTQRLLAAVPVPDPVEQRRRREARDSMIAATSEDLAG